MNVSHKPGLYIHIPFCRSKCGYCDFYSIENIALINPFLKTLLNEITKIASILQTKDIFDTIYFGGGTPSLLSIKSIEKILMKLSEHFRVDQNCEMTIEVNPGTVDSDRLNQLVDLGFNRISIGVQSFIDEELQLLERIHKVAQAVNTIEQSQDAGFKNINVDLIFAIPNQSLENWNFSLEKTLTYYPDHISVYNLTYESGTPFYTKMKNGQIRCFNGEKENDFFSIAHTKLLEKGYLHYEVSNYAKSDSNISRHNYKYWNHTPYLGFGPSAHSFWGNKRWANARSLNDYMGYLNQNKLPHSLNEILKKDQLVFEHIFLALRTYRGLHLSDFEKKFEINFIESYKTKIQELTDNNLAIIHNDYFKLTERGMLICDEILPDFAKV